MWLRLGVTHDLAFDLATLPFKPPLLRNSPQRALNPTQSRGSKTDLWPLFIYLFEKGQGGLETSGLRLNSLPTTFPKESSHGPHKIFFTSRSALSSSPSSTVCNQNVCACYCRRPVFHRTTLNIRNENGDVAIAASSQWIWGGKYKMRRMYGSERAGRAGDGRRAFASLAHVNHHSPSSSVIKMSERETERKREKTWE
ncbi:uncharacterized [Tachysurus ichikawai]